MGIFSKIGDAFKGVVKGIVKVLDKVTGGRFSKWMSNKWVKGALMAVSIVTGGIAIANGIMAMGEAGIGQAVATFAKNMSLESGGKVVSAVIKGGKDFIGGVAEGLMNPMKSDAGQALSSGVDSVFGSATGEAISGTDVVNQGTSAAEKSSQAAIENGVSAAGAPSPVSIPGGTPNAPAIPEGLGVGDSLTGMKAADPGYNVSGFSGVESPTTGIPDAMAGGVPESLASTSMPAGYNEATGLMPGQAAVAPQGGMESIMSDLGMGAPEAGGFTPTGAAPDGILSQMKQAGAGATGKAGEYFGSPGGMKTLADMVSGWAQGAQKQKMIDDYWKEEKRRRKSWETYSQPRFGGG